MKLFRLEEAQKNKLNLILNIVTMKKIFSFLCLIVAVTAMTSCSSAKEEKGTSGTGNAVLDNIFERKSVRAYLNKGVEKEKIDLMLRAGMAALRVGISVHGNLW